MVNTPNTYRLDTLPPAVLNALLASHQVGNPNAHRAWVLDSKRKGVSTPGMSAPVRPADGLTGAQGGSESSVTEKTSQKAENKAESSGPVSLFDLFDFTDVDGDGTPDIAVSVEEDAVDVPVTIKDSTIIWATDNYADRGDDHTFFAPVTDISFIVPRVDKSKEEQKKRVKEKAEVFTPSWLVNQMNNMVDDHQLGAGAFNVASADGKSWTPSVSPVNFPAGKTWVSYVVSRRMEATCGEGPYLMSPYDTTTGVGIPVRNETGFARVGLLDRKLRVVTENAPTDKWVPYALLACLNTYGYEWQGDNLLLARLNMVNTFIEYHVDALGVVPNESLLLDVARIAAWNIWQMDGLKQVAPLSCSATCVACKNRTRGGHDGKLPAVRFPHSGGFHVVAFEDLLPLSAFSPVKKNTKK